MGMKKMPELHCGRDASTAHKYDMLIETTKHLSLRIGEDDSCSIGMLLATSQACFLEWIWTRIILASRSAFPAAVRPWSSRTSKHPSASMCAQTSLVRTIRISVQQQSVTEMRSMFTNRLTGCSPTEMLCAVGFNRWQRRPEHHRRRAFRLPQSRSRLLARRKLFFALLLL